MRNQRTLGFVALGIGIAVGAVALATYLTSAASDVGDVSGIESSLTEGRALFPGSDTTQPPETGALADAPEETTNLVPLWHPNPDSPIDLTSPESIPVELTIVTIGVNADILPYGVSEQTGQMEVPHNVSEVAWYKHGPTPGEGGSAVLAAHVDLESQGPGVFFNLGLLQPGDVIQVGFDSGAIRRFEVVGRKEYDKSELPLDVVFSKNGPPILTLITCGGGFDPDSARYDSNVVVYARPLTPGSEGALQ